MNPPVFLYRITHDILEVTKHFKPQKQFSISVAESHVNVSLWQTSHQHFQPVVLTFIPLICVSVQRNMAAFLGKMVTLPCRAPGNISIVAVTWSRPDLKGKYVLLFQDGKFVLDNQHPSFKNRVVLKDNQMKNGDLSLILNDVHNSDVGTYECRYKEKKGRTVLTSESMSTVNLTVPLSGGFDHYRFIFM